MCFILAQCFNFQEDEIYFEIIFGVIQISVLYVMNYHLTPLVLRTKNKLLWPLLYLELARNKTARFQLFVDPSEDIKQCKMSISILVE